MYRRISDMTERLRATLTEGPIWQCLTEAHYACHVLRRIEIFTDSAANTNQLVRFNDNNAADTLNTLLDDSRALRDSWEISVSEYITNLKKCENVHHYAVRFTSLLVGAYYDSDSQRYEVRACEDVS